MKEGRKDGYHVFPLIMGLAKNALGMGKPKRGPGRPKGASRDVPPARRASRPAAGGLARGFTGELVSGIERMQSDVAAMRSALHDIARLASRF